MMNKNLLVFVLALFISVGNVFAQNEDDLKKLALANAKTAAAATLKLDFNTVLTHTLPSVVEIMGGKEAATNLLTTQFKSLTEQGFVFEKAEINKIVDYKEEYGQIRCVIEGFNQIKMPTSRIKSTSYMLGIYDDTLKQWYFIEAKQLKNVALRDMVLPDFKTDFVIPDDVVETETIE